MVVVALIFVGVHIGCSYCNKILLALLEATFVVVFDDVVVVVVAVNVVVNVVVVVLFVINDQITFSFGQ